MKLFSLPTIRKYLNEFRRLKHPEIFPSHKKLSIEHIVPRSYVGKKHDLCNDMHNLILLPIKLNQRRSNYRYVNKLEIANKKNVILDENGFSCDYYDSRTCSIQNSKERVFVPSNLEKGMIARSIAYSIENYKMCFLLDILLSREDLISWHLNHPVNNYEYNKHKFVYDKQKNVNDFILNEKLVLDKFDN